MHEVNKSRCEIQLEAPLAGRIIVGESVMIIVESLPQRHQADGHVLHGPDPLVVGLHPEHVGGGVDEPGEVEHADVAEDGDEEPDLDRLHPEQGGHGGGDDEGEGEEEGEVVLVLDHHQRVSLQILHVDGFTSRDHFGMLPHTQPTNMREEESPLKYKVTKNHEGMKDYTTFAL